MCKVLIADVAVSDSVTKRFEKLGFTVVDAREMTKRFVQWDGWTGFDRRSTLLIFPGNGANIIKKCLPKKWLDQWQWVGLSAKRYWEPGQDPVVFVGVVDKMILGIRNVVVVDDVISSGMTVKKVRRVNDPWIPGTRWHAATWVAQRAASLRGFDQLMAVEEAGEKNRKASVNSLSTFVVDEEIACSFAKRKLTNGCSLGFHKLLEQLRS